MSYYLHNRKRVTVVGDAHRDAAFFEFSYRERLAFVAVVCPTCLWRNGHRVWCKEA